MRRLLLIALRLRIPKRRGTSSSWDSSDEITLIIEVAIGANESAIPGVLVPVLNPTTGVGRS